jgi:hypothetical protein
MTTVVPGVWTLNQLRESLLTRGVELKADRSFDRLSFALSCLVAGGEAERLGFDSYRIYPRRPCGVKKLGSGLQPLICSADAAGPKIVGRPG